MTEFEEQETELDDFWEELRANPMGATPLQIEFARQTILDPHATAKDCARRAGSTARGKSLNNVASSLKNNERVKAILEMADGYRSGTEEIGDPDELDRILWRIVKHGKGQVQIRAIEVYDRREQAKKVGNGHDPSSEEIVKILASLGEAGRLLAADLGLQNELTAMRTNGAAHA